MSPVHDPVPRALPQPPATPEALRATLAQVAPERLEHFDAERAAATAAARSEVSAAPLRRFVEQWAIHVAIERHPKTATRLRELEAHADTVDDRDEARALAAEVRRILAAAAVEAGLGDRLGLR